MHERKNNFMNGTIVSFDVSKGNCHYQGFICNDTPMSKPRILYLTKKSFRELEDYVTKLKNKALTDEVFYVFESTGVYHKVLQKYLDDNGLTYYIISPLLSAKYRQTELHSNKTDPLDCGNIAKVYYGCNSKKLRVYKSPENRYDQLQKLNRYYEDVLEHLRKYKVTFKAYLDVAMPDFDSCFPKKDIYNPLGYEILKKWPHPKLILGETEENMVKYLTEKTNHSESFIRRYVNVIKDWADEVYSGCESDDEIVKKIVLLIEHIEKTSFEADSILQTIIEGAKKESLFKQLFSIPGIGENLAGRIVAEMGDISRFENVNKLASYAGIDPMIRQSGKHDGIHYAISKKGNKRLRCLLYLAVTFNIRAKKMDRLYTFYQRKRQQSVPLKPKVAKIAAARKLLTIIYGMSKTGELYAYN